MSGQREALTIYTGPMKSGKSSHLLEHLSRARDALGYSIYVFKPATDNRNDDLNQVTNRNFGSWCALPAPRTENGYSSSLFILESIFRHKQAPKPDLVGIDEVQFFDQDIKDVVKELIYNGIKVAVSGLNRDFKDEAFPAMESLMPLGKVIDLEALCTYKNGDNHSCGARATMTQRLIDGLPASYNSPVIIIETKDKNITYEARCYDHWFCPDIPRSRLLDRFHHD